MKIEINVRLDEKVPGFYKDAVDEYLKRLGPYCQISCKYIRKKKQWDKMVIPTDGCLDLYVKEGKHSVSSEEWSRQITGWEDSGIRTVRIFAGEEIAEGEDRDDAQMICLSSLSMHPAMQGMILCEQIYRGYRIKNH